MSEISPCEELRRRCKRLAETSGETSISIGDILIEINRAGEIAVAIVSSPGQFGWSASRNVYDAFAPDQEQDMQAIRDTVLPALRNYMLLDDLADA